MDATKLPSRERRVNHGLGGTPTYRSWYSMLQRCTNPEDIGWKHYGGRGIRVCERWMSLAMFVEDMGLRPPGATLDRCDTNGNYEPGNCRWTTVVEQNRNRTSNVLSYDKRDALRADLAAGMKQRDAAIKYGVSQATVSRAARGETWGSSVQ